MQNRLFANAIRHRFAYHDSINKREQVTLNKSSHFLQAFKTILCGSKRKDSNGNININYPSINRKLRALLIPVIRFLHVRARA